MSDRNDVIEFFKRRPHAEVGFSDVHAELSQVPERTLRRWLAQLVREGVLDRSGSRKGTRYRWAGPVAPPADSTKPEVRVAPAEPLVFSQASLQSLERVRTPLYTRPPVTYAHEWVESYVPNRTFYLTAAQRKQLQAGKRPGIQQRAGTCIEKIFDRLLVDLSYNSARLEGNTYTIGETERLVLQGIGAEGKLDAERIMILNHKEAIRYLAQNVQRLTLSEETIRTLHYLLADSLVAPGMAGQIRDESIRISGTTYAPLEGRERLTRLLAQLLKKVRQIEDVFEQSFFLLGHISYLQAFVDVNKRTARLASIIPLITNDYMPQSFIDVDKDDYLDAISCLYELRDTRPLAEIYVWSYLRACEHYSVGAQPVVFDEIAARYRPLRRAMVAEIVQRRVRPAQVRKHVQAHMPKEVERAHRDKFLQDVLTELEHLDIARIAALGITRQQLEAWMKLRSARP
ncbi:MAG TPA: Fic family protein [Steroidobacteraceae bacterium]